MRSVRIPGNAVIAPKAKKAKMPFTTIDSVVKGAASLGVPDVQAGTLAAQLLIPEIKKRLAGPSGRASRSSSSGSVSGLHAL